jgi:ketosteroid isomerase-like protein
MIAMFSGRFRSMQPPDGDAYMVGRAPAFIAASGARETAAGLSPALRIIGGIGVADYPIRRRRDNGIVDRTAQMLSGTSMTKEVTEMSNIDTVRSAYQAFHNGDLAALKEIFTEDAVWYSSDEVRPGGETHGRDEIIDMMAQLAEHWTSVSIDPSTYIDGGEYVVVLGTQRFANDKGSEQSPFVHVLRFDRDGKVVRGEFHADSAKMAKLQG